MAFLIDRHFAPAMEICLQNLKHRSRCEVTAGRGAHALSFFVTFYPLRTQGQSFLSTSRKLSQWGYYKSVRQLRKTFIVGKIFL